MVPAVVAGTLLAFALATYVCAGLPLSPDGWAGDAVWTRAWGLSLTKAGDDSGVPIPANACDASVERFELQVGRLLIRWSHS